jgi:hypothetical protein
MLPSVKQDQNMRVPEKSANNLDRAAESMWLTEFSVTYMFWSCVTLGLSISENFLAP